MDASFSREAEGTRADRAVLAFLYSDDSIFCVLAAEGMPRFQVAANPPLNGPLFFFSPA